MSLGHCSCPDCGTTLRIRDRSFIGRQVDCPECQAKLTIAEDAERRLIAEHAKRDVEPAKKTKTPPKLLAPAANAFAATGFKLISVARSPLALAWALAIGVTSFIAIMMLQPNVRFRTPGKLSPATAAPQAVDDQQGDATDPQQASMSVDPDSPAIADATDPTVLPEPERTNPVEDPAPPVATKPVQAADNVEPAAAPQVPIRVPVPAPAKFDPEKQFQQRLQKFATAQPVKRQDLIELVEEMLGAPIRYDRAELGEAKLDRPVSISLENTTVGGVLKALLDPAEWDYVIEEDGIRLKPRRVADREP